MWLSVPALLEARGPHNSGEVCDVLGISPALAWEELELCCRPARLLRQGDFIYTGTGRATVEKAAERAASAAQAARAVALASGPGPAPAPVQAEDAMAVD